MLAVTSSAETGISRGKKIMMYLKFHACHQKGKSFGAIILLLLLLLQG